MRKPQLIEIARLARPGQLILPKQARSLLAYLAEIESSLPFVTIKLTSLLTALLDQKNTHLFSPEKSLEFLKTLADIVELLDRLIAIARNHPDPQNREFKRGWLLAVWKPSNKSTICAITWHILESICAPKISHRNAIKVFFLTCS